MNKKGFTLVEILGVVALLAIIIVIVGTKGFGAFNNTKKKITKEQLNLVKESLNILMIDIEKCDDSLKEYEDLKKYFEITEEVTSCKQLQNVISNKKIKADKLLVDGYVDKNTKEVISNKDIKIVINYNNDDKITIVDLRGTGDDIGKSVSLTKECGKQEFGNEELLYGDIDLSGSLNYDDAIICQNIIKEETPEKFQLNNIQEKIFLAPSYGSVLIDENYCIAIFQSSMFPDEYTAVSGTLIIDKSNICGDINNDNVVDAKDSDTLKKFLENPDLDSYEKENFRLNMLLSNFQKRNADMNGDKVLNNYDLLILNNYLNIE